MGSISPDWYHLSVRPYYTNNTITLPAVIVHTQKETKKEKFDKVQFKKVMEFAKEIKVIRKEMKRTVSTYPDVSSKSEERLLCWITRLEDRIKKMTGQLIESLLD